MASDVAHVITIYGRGHDDELLYDLECRASLTNPRARCTLFEPCGCVMPEWVADTMLGHRCRRAATGEHQWNVMEGRWVTTARGCWVLEHDELYEPLEELATLLSTLDREIRGQWAITWETDGDDPASLTFAPLARLGARPEFPEVRTLSSEDTVPSVDRFPGAGLEVDVRDVIESRVFVSVGHAGGVVIDAEDATLAVLDRVREEGILR